MLSSLLKERTAQSHQSLEAVVVRTIKSIRDKDGYIRLLHKFYGFHHPLELLQDQYLNDEIVPAYSSRRKASVILKDLQALKAQLPVEEASILPSINSLASAIGSFYVTEGSTQGGTIVANMLIRYAGADESSTRFLYAYGENGKEMWGAFKSKIDNFQNNEAFNTELIRAANDTFRLFQQWMQS